MKAQIEPEGLCHYVVGPAYACPHPIDVYMCLCRQLDISLPADRCTTVTVTIQPSPRTQMQKKKKVDQGQKERLL